MHPIILEQVAADRMGTALRAGAERRLVRSAGATDQTWRLTLAERALRLAQRLDREGAVVPAAPAC